MKKWKIIIYQDNKEVRSIPLKHEYENEEQASREAENIAEKECKEGEDWTLVEVDKRYFATIYLSVFAKNEDAAWEKLEQDLKEANLQDLLDNAEIKEGEE